MFSFGFKMLITYKFGIYLLITVTTHTKCEDFKDLFMFFFILNLKKTLFKVFSHTEKKVTCYICSSGRKV